MSNDEYESKQARNVIQHHFDPVERYRLTMGYINMEQVSGHFFLSANPFMDLIDEMNVWLADVARMHLPPDPRTKLSIPTELPAQEVAELKQIWYGHVKLYQKRDRFQEILEQYVVFDTPKEYTPLESYWDMPALLHMNPKSSTKDDKDPRILIQEPIRFDYAWEGYDPVQLADVVKFKWDTENGVIQMFNTDEEIMEAEALVMEISRESFHKLIKILIMEYKPRKHFVYYWMSKILESYRYILATRSIQSNVGNENSYVVDYQS